MKLILLFLITLLSGASYSSSEGDFMDLNLDEIEITDYSTEGQDFVKVYFYHSYYLEHTSLDGRVDHFDMDDVDDIGIAHRFGQRYHLQMLGFFGDDIMSGFKFEVDLD